MSLSNPIISLSHVEKSFEQQKVLNDISFHIKKGEFVTLLGESGCGKSTLLNMVGGFILPDDGEVRIQGEIVKGPNRNCIILFQHHNLLPWRTVLDNVLLGLEGNKRQNKEKAKQALEFVGLSNYLKHHPHELSGGMQQRVAIARAFTLKPDVILLDEPFAALDTFNRYHLQDELVRMQENENVSILLVTHDIDEAVYLSDRILIMSANPGEVFKTITIDLPKPRNRSHADFHYYRSKIFRKFQLSSEVIKPEYYI